MKRLVVVAGLLVAAGLFAACGDDDDNGNGGNGNGNGASDEQTIDPAQFQAVVDNLFFSLEPGSSRVYEGSEPDEDTGELIELRVEETVLDETDTVGGVEVVVVEVTEYEDGELAEVTLDYYAQHNDGTVYYLGERVDNYEDGEVVDHEGEWLAGDGDNMAGIFMLPEPQVGDVFEQERAAGIAEDRSEVIEVAVSISTPAGDFTGCIKTEDLDPIDDVTEFKYYCPGTGLVREENDEGELLIELISL